MSTSNTTPLKGPLVGVGAVVFGPDDQVLMIRRGKPPRKGAWAIPGGHQEWGETVFECAAREVQEETNTTCVVQGFVDFVDAIAQGDDGTVHQHYTLLDVWAEWQAGDPVAGDDAMAAAWKSPAEIAEMDLWPETRRIIDMARKIRGRVIP